MDGQESVVMFPSLGMGHLIPTVELAKLLATQGFSVTVVLVESPFGTSAASEPLISRVSAAHPSISFHRLPTIAPPPSSNPVPFLISKEILRLANPHLLDFLRKCTSNVKALVVDMFCTAALDVARELHIPSYVYFTSAAGTLIAFLNVSAVQSNLADGRSVQDLGDTLLHFPGVPPMPASSLPPQVFHNDEVNEAIVYHFDRLLLADGIVVNTFESMEKSAVGALAEGICLPRTTSIPPVYCVGPLVSAESGEPRRHDCIAWLDRQPEKSVVFLCFGSMGSFPAEQLKEIAVGLEGCGQRFLWVVRNPQDPDPGKRLFGARAEPDLEVLLPEGFLRRTEGRGMVVKSWAPQAAVLGHASVGGFVSHCGWNSTLEAVREGVAVIAWPLYAEQRMNKLYLVEAGLAVEMEGYDRGFVSGEEVERKIRLLMESEVGKVMKEKAERMKEAALAAQKVGGSSAVALLELVRAVRKGGGGR